MFRRNRAGRSATAKFQEERRANIRDNWVGIMVGVALTLAAFAGVVLGTGTGQLVSAFAFGVGVAGLAFGWVLGFDAHSLRWTWGAFGERWTAEELAKLGSGWHVFHDIPDGGGNWDHVVVGPPGVFVIDSKFLTVWGRLPDGAVERDKVLYLPAGRLVETLQSRPARLTDVQRAKVRTAIESLADDI